MRRCEIVRELQCLVSRLLNRGKFGCVRELNEFPAQHTGKVVFPNGAIEGCQSPGKPHIITVEESHISTLRPDLRRRYEQHLARNLAE